MVKVLTVIFLLTTLILLTSCQHPPQVSNIELYRDNSIDPDTFYMDDEAISFDIHFSENIRDSTLHFKCSYLEGEDKDLLSSTIIGTGTKRLVDVTNWEITLSRTGPYWPRGSYLMTISYKEKEIAHIPFQVATPSESSVTIRQTDPLPYSPTNDLIKQYSWKYHGQEFRYEFTTSRQSYNYYANKPRFAMHTPSDYLIYATDPFDDNFINDLSNAFLKISADLGFDQFQTVGLVVSFIQNLTYADDRIAYGYEKPKYPLETLVEEGGDCEDTSILLSSILDSMGIMNVLLFFPKHVAVGLGVSGEQQGRSYRHKGIDYYYIESTNPGALGTVPKELIDIEPTIVPLVSEAVIVHDIDYTELGKVIKLHVEVINLGSAMSKSVKVMSGFETNNPDSNYYQESDSFQLDVNQTADLIFYLDFPFQNENRMIVKTFHDNQLSYYSDRNWDK